ncbi:alpha/beta hydrolase [Rubrobacter marinus]|uniref:alpha/beta hydrolase n=1 Tax=Rubrobacter marinus TaxID=2653852 RepID=UPI001D18622F|nr:alpha/beta hydrolase [Rubrobacter marinus]
MPAEGDDPNTLLLLHGTGATRTTSSPRTHDQRQRRPPQPARQGLGARHAPLLQAPRRGIFDEEDLIRRTHELAGFVEEAAGEYGIDRGRVWAVGFSNGANIAASLLLLHPGLLAGAVLLRAMVPLEPDPTPDLSGTPVYLAAGRSDPIVPADNTERLAGLLEEAGADVTLDWQPGGHGIGRPEVDAARSWLEGVLAKPS